MLIQSFKRRSFFQSSLRKQSVVLYGTFERLNSCVEKIKDYYKIGDGRSVDNVNDKFCIPYSESPGTDYYEDFKMYKSKCNSLEQSVKYLESKNTQYAQQLEEITQEHEKNMMENNDELHKLRNENARLESDINGLNGNSKQLEQVIQDLQSNIDDLRTEKIVLEQDLDRSNQTC
jgi:predicted RNase H-like nuclease (RuvC/YqgF family)